MLKKYKFISALSAVSALTISLAFSNGNAKDAPLPSVEVNFKALEKLKPVKVAAQKKSATKKTKKSTKQKAQAEKNHRNAERIVKPVLKPVMEAAPVYAAPAPVQAVAVPEPKEIIANNSGQEKNIPPIVIKKDDAVIEAEQPEAAELPAETQEKGIFSSMLDKVPFFSKKDDVATANEETELANPDKVENEPSEMARDDKTPENEDIYDNTHVEEFLQEKTGVPAEPSVKKAKPVVAKPALKPLVEVQNKPVKKDIATKESKNIPLPHIKENTSPVRTIVESAPEVVLPSPRADIQPPAQIIIIKPEPIEKTEIIKQQEVEKSPQIDAVVNAPEEAVKAEENKDVVATMPVEATPEEPVEKDVAHDEMWQNFLEEAKKKAERLDSLNAVEKPAQVEPESVDNASPLMAQHNPHELAKVSVPEPVVVEKTEAAQPKTEDLSEVSDAAEADEAINNTEEPSEVSADEFNKYAARDESATPQQKSETPQETTRAIETATLEPVIRKNADVPAPVVKKNDTSIFSSFVSALPYFGNQNTEEKAKQPVPTAEAPIAMEANPEQKNIIPNQDVTDAKLDASLSDTKELFDRKFVNSNKANIENEDAADINIDSKTEKKLGDVIDQGMKENQKPIEVVIPSIPAEIPPVPELAIAPMEIATANPAGDMSVTLMEAEEKPVVPATTTAQADNQILISVAFDGNSVQLTPVDKSRVSDFVQQILTSGKRLKILSYARGVDGEVNSARRISLQRAIAVRAEMIKAGLEKSRITVQAIGNNPGDQEFANNVNIYELE